MFGANLDAAVRFHDLLASAGVERGLIGPRETSRLWERHLLNCAVLAEAIPTGATVCDIGSGAGLPGLVLALHRPDLVVTLVEPLLRRVMFLDEAVAHLKLSQVEVVRARAEEQHGRAAYDVVTSRAVAPLGKLLGWSMPLVAPQGALLAIKGSTVAQELVDASAVVSRWTTATPEVLSLGVGVVQPPVTVLRLERRQPSG